MQSMVLALIRFFVLYYNMEELLMRGDREREQEKTQRVFYPEQTPTITLIHSYRPSLQDLNSPIRAPISQDRYTED